MDFGIGLGRQWATKETWPLKGFRYAGASGLVKASLSAYRASPLRRRVETARERPAHNGTVCANPRAGIRFDDHARLERHRRATRSWRLTSSGFRSSTPMRLLHRPTICCRPVLRQPTILGRGDNACAWAWQCGRDHNLLAQAVGGRDARRRHRTSRPNSGPVLAAAQDTWQWGLAAALSKGTAAMAHRVIAHEGMR